MEWRCKVDRMDPIAWRSPQDDTPIPGDDAAHNAKVDYAGALGTVIAPEWVYGYRQDDAVDIAACGKVQVRVIKTAPTDILHWSDDYLDPYWDVEVVSDPENILRGASSLWVHGPSYRVAEDA